MKYSCKKAIQFVISLVCIFSFIVNSNLAAAETTTTYYGKYVKRYEISPEMKLWRASTAFLMDESGNNDGRFHIEDGQTLVVIFEMKGLAPLSKAVIHGMREDRYYGPQPIQLHPFGNLLIYVEKDYETTLDFWLMFCPWEECSLKAYTVAVY